jgi:hypothetical protein
MDASYLPLPKRSAPQRRFYIGFFKKRSGVLQRHRKYPVSLRSSL